MTKEILFRGQRTDNKEWVYGNQLKLEGLYFIVPSNTNLVTICHKRHFHWDNLIEVIPKTVGQFIGLKDKNEVKIFEGDIVNPMEKGFKLSPFVVKMLEGYWSIAVFKTDTALEIIGNVFDNPEKVKVE